MALVSAKCPRKYPRLQSTRKTKGMLIPEDIEKKKFLSNFRQVVASHCNQTLLRATCHDEPHIRSRTSKSRRERHYHINISMDNNFAHQRIAQAFHREHGIKVTFCFRNPRFEDNLMHLMVPGQRRLEDLDVEPAKYPPSLDLAALVLVPDAEAVEAPLDDEEQWTSNEGESSDNDEEVAAHQSLRGHTALVTAACPRQYPRDAATRRAKGCVIPEDFSKEEFLTKFRRTVGKYSTAIVEKATCHSEPHKRFRPSSSRRERHYHLALKMAGNFAHKKIADAFQKEHGIRISFSFKLKRFVGNLQYLMTPGKKPSTDLDLEPAKYPPNLDIQSEMASARHPGDAPDKEHKKRKRLSFDEVSNIIIEGIGDGPLRTARALEAAARALKHKGAVELWNYIGSLKSSSEIGGLISKVWQLQGDLVHPLWHTTSVYPLQAFDHSSLRQVEEWRNGKWKSHVLVLSGDGGLGKTSMAEALMQEVSVGGYWFIDDPDDFRELDGHIQSGQGIVVDEITLASFSVNQVATHQPHCRDMYLQSIVETSSIHPCAHPSHTHPAIHQYAQPPSPTHPTSHGPKLRPPNPRQCSSGVRWYNAGEEAIRFGED